MAMKSKKNCREEIRSNRAKAAKSAKPAKTGKPARAAGTQPKRVAEILAKLDDATPMRLAS